MGVRFSSWQRTTAGRLIGCIRPYTLHAVMGFLAFAAGGATVLALGQGVKTLVDHGLHGGGPSAMRRTALGLLVLVFIYGASAFGRAYLSGFLGERVTTDLRRQVLAKLMEHGPAFFEREGSGLMWSRVSSDADLVKMMIFAVVMGFRNMLIIVGGLYAMFSANLALTGLLLLISPVITGGIIFLGRGIRRYSNSAQQASARASAFALEVIDGIRTVKVFSQEKGSSERFDSLSEAAFHQADRRNVRAGVVMGAAIWMIFGAGVLLVWAAGEQVLAGRASEGQASAFIFYALVVATSGAGLSDTWGQVQKGIGGADRIFALLDQAPTIRSPSAPARVAMKSLGAIVFDRVSFRYPTRPEVAALDGLDLTIPTGAVTAFVGPSGAGKSTVFQLLLRLYDPDEGQVCVGGANLRHLDLDELRAQIAIVPQDPALFEGTLQENIRFGRRGATDREVEAAAQTAQAMEFISRLPNGMQTEVGARGAQLSGGQRQRIAIARAMLRDPRILLLDEATNALDAGSEALIQSALNTLARGRTTLIVAHKLATVRRADTIVVMDQGRMVSKGSHAKLLAENGLYARLANLQLI